ncbi:hypothetical protein JQC92_22055 [Shewanella sp. 202IG2-18]|nr:hypothetical protein [Parashewanella hymeniacidonis]MBM7074660.1 hypothetical protein [Parashewanella hymeniacidonis]
MKVEEFTQLNRQEMAALLTQQVEQIDLLAEQNSSQSEQITGNHSPAPY